MSKEDFNPYDLLGLPDEDEARRYQEDLRQEGDKIDRLIHRIFSSDDGKEYLDLITKSLIMTPTAQPGMSDVEIGIHEGVKQFIRNIILTINKVENGE